MSRYGGEKVLVVPRRLLEELGTFQGLCFDVERYLPRLLDPSANFFLDRADAEEDPTHKQLIPYALFHHSGRFLRYTRGTSSGEARLATKVSIGIGGHINQSDHESSSLERDPYLNGVEREIREELVINDPYTQQIVALINDDSNDVGRVHLGVVHVFKLESDRVASNEAEIGALSFETPSSLHNDWERLETWSRICLQSLDRFLR